MSVASLTTAHAPNPEQEKKQLLVRIISHVAKGPDIGDLLFNQ